MTWIEITAIGIGVVSLLGVLETLRRSRHPFRRALTSAACGAGALGIVNLLANYTGFTLAVNYITAFVAVILGLPGVITLLVLRLLLIGGMV